MEYTIKLTWDPEAGVWIATSGDIPGLVLESGSFDALGSASPCRNCWHWTTQNPPSR